MFMTAINFLMVLFFVLLGQSNAWSQPISLECYKYENEDNKISEINDITLGWSSTTDQASMLFVKDKKNKNFITDLDCPLFPKIGICGLSDDGGEIEIYKVNSTKSKILLKIAGLIIPELVEPEGYTYLSISEQDGLTPRYVVLNKVSSQNCYFEY